MGISPNAHNSSIGKSRLVQKLKKENRSEQRSNYHINLPYKLLQQDWVVENGGGFLGELCGSWVISRKANASSASLKDSTVIMATPPRDPFRPSRAANGSYLSGSLMSFPNDSLTEDTFQRPWNFQLRRSGYAEFIYQQP